MNSGASLKERLRRSAFAGYRKSETELHELRSILWECTLKCNLNCGHCGSDCTASCTVPDADSRLFFKALENIKTKYKPEKVMIGITGGEPLMRADLARIIRHVKEMGFPVGIVSNGYGLNPEKFVELINAGLDTLTVSLDGLEKEHNELRKNPMSHKRALTAIKNAASFKRQSLGRRWFDFDVVTCVHRGNLDTLEQVRDMLIDAGVEHWRLFSIFPTGRADDNRYALSGAEFRKLMDFIVSERLKRKIDVMYSCEGWLGGYELKARPSYYFCRAGITNAGIFIDGKVGGCISARSADFIAGDLHNQSFLDIWENGFDRMRNRSWARKGRCAECADWKYCLGNGLHLYSSTDAEPARCNLALTLEP